MSAQAAPANSGGFPASPAPSAHRNAELGLLVFATVVMLVALFIVEQSQERAVTLDLLGYAAAFMALYTIAHLAVRWLTPYADPLLLPTVALLNGLGLVIIHRIDLAKMEKAQALGEAIGPAEAPRQIMWTAVAVIGFISLLFVLRDHRTLARFSYTLGLGGLVLLALPALLPASLSEINGAKIWIRLPGFSIQPGEFAKISLLIFIAALLVAKRDLFTSAGTRVWGLDVPRLRDVGPIIAAAAIALLVLVIQKDLGTSLLVFSSVLVLIYIATGRVAWLIIGASLFAVGCVAAYFLFSHVRLRVEVWADPFEDFFNKGYQIGQSLFSLATGGMGGTGLGSGRPSEIPFASTDFIIAAIGEELGLIGLTAIILLYAVLVIRGFRTAITVRDSFGKLLAAGLSFTIAMQVFVVIGGVTKLIPLTGLTTPFMSYGGSSLVSNYVLVAILLVISHEARRPHVPIRRTVPASLTDAPTAMVKRQ
jgi:cell division protein FtsW (lipid II flippase)